MPEFYYPEGLVKSPKTPEPPRIRTNYEKKKNPPPTVGLQKDEKNTEKLQKWPKKDKLCILGAWGFGGFWGSLLRLFLSVSVCFRLFLLDDF